MNTADNSSIATFGQSAFCEDFSLCLKNYEIEIRWLMANGMCILKLSGVCVFNVRVRWVPTFSKTVVGFCNKVKGLTVFKLCHYCTIAEDFAVFAWSADSCWIFFVNRVAQCSQWNAIWLSFINNKCEDSMKVQNVNLQAGETTHKIPSTSTTFRNLAEIMAMTTRFQLVQQHHHHSQHYRPATNRKVSSPKQYFHFLHLYCCLELNWKTASPWCLRSRTALWWGTVLARLSTSVAWFFVWVNPTGRGHLYRHLCRHKTTNTTQLAIRQSSISFDQTKPCIEY